MPPYAEPLTEPAQSGLVLGTEVVEPAAPPPSADADNSGGERMVAEATITQVASELQVEAASGDDNVVMLSAERTVPPASAI